MRALREGGRVMSHTRSVRKGEQSTHRERALQRALEAAASKRLAVEKELRRAKAENTRLAVDLKNADAVAALRPMQFAAQCVAQSELRALNTRQRDCGVGSGGQPCHECIACLKLMYAGRDEVWRMAVRRAGQENRLCDCDNCAPLLALMLAPASDNTTIRQLAAEVKP